MAFTLNGVGTTFYGHRFLPDGTYSTTEWFILIGIPLFPLRTIQVVEASRPYGTSAFNAQSFSSRPLPLDKAMVAKIYALEIGALIVIGFVLPAVARAVGL
jgi:hypothetical protein